MNTKTRFAASSLVILLLAACGGKKQAPNPNAARPYPVITVPVKTVTGYSAYPASIQGRNNNDVRAKISGYIKEVLVDEGQAVRKGQVLFRLETNTLSQTADAAKSGVNAAEASISTAEANVNAAQVEVNKLTPLVEKNIISNVQLETAKANLRSAQSQLVQARANRGQAQANYRSAAANVEYSIIRSPIDGIVGKLPLRVGSLVGPTDPTPLTTVSDVSEIYAYFSMNEKEYLSFLEQTPGLTVAQKLNNIPPVSLELANGSEYGQKGKVKAVTGQIDPNTGTILFRVSFPNQGRLLANGNSGTIKIPKTYTDVLAVPEAATFEQQGIIYVYKVGKDTVNSVVVGVLDRINNMALLGGGVNKGDTIIAAGVGGLRNGAAIIPRPADFDSITNAIKPVF
ncbi:efflux RND transporter periplasmic adaptor subunit [Niabella sp. CC-SYL272]|uniref:efflux RND transporter periplasmic adaptor subunit n=1 Tax=Niabella agricola TaxID=2891571 RepID=UPI001F1A0C85|nr:efflux RND transporter periplasmic adaptor subunit [Niabella agricola]MCF3111345.1 efflux RND transporter periplasmic adaptor subunit [Niabella agricola]